MRSLRNASQCSRGSERIKPAPQQGRNIAWLEAGAAARRSQAALGHCACRLLSAGIAFLTGVILAIPALKLTALSRTRASASASACARLPSDRAQTVST